MKIGIFTVLFSDWSFEKSLKYISKLGYEMVEIGAGGYVPSTHLPEGKIDSILKGKAGEYRNLIEKHGLEISALSSHANHLDQDLDIRKATNDEFMKIIEAAGMLEAPAVVTFSGCPFDWGRWYSFPFENIEIYDKGWKEAAEVWNPILDHAKDHNVKVSIEVHPGTAGIAYNLDTAKRMGL